jgi:F420H(2)-dependent quinone reductase
MSTTGVHRKGDPPLGASDGPPAKGTQDDRRRLAFPADASRAHSVTAEPQRGARLPPRWFIRAFWLVHRGIYSVTGGRFGLRSPTADRWGMMRLRTVGRRTGEQRTVILGYFQDGPNLVTMAMNGWADPDPAWWLNLKAQPDASVDEAGGSRPVHARAADKDERPRLWAKWADYDENLDAYAALRSRETQVVILEPRPD